MASEDAPAPVELHNLGITQKMSESPQNKELIKDYLLGKISDEATLAGLEESLFTDGEFGENIALVEDEIINEYVLGNLSQNDREFADKYFFTNTDRQFKLKLTQELKAKADLLKPTVKEEKPSFFESLAAFFRQPLYAGALAVLLVAAIGLSIFFRSKQEPTELAQLQTVYQKERSIETRISGFDYAPFTVVRGAENQTDEQKRKLRLIETKLLEAVETNPNAANHHALGVFYLTQAKYADAIKELEKSVQLDAQNARFYNDLGSAYCEIAKNGDKDKKLENLARANESFSKAVELDANLFEALFNKSLVLQALNLPRQAKESWELYLQKDSASKWSDEARKNLEKIAQMQSSFKTKEQVLEDFLTAYRSGNEEIAWKINCQTKEMISGVWLPDQLTRRYLQARKNKDETTAQESIEALTAIGNLEKNRNADFFVSELADYYKRIDDRKIDDLLRAKAFVDAAFQLILTRKYNQVYTNFQQARQIFEKNGNISEKIVIDYLIAFNKRDLGQLKESFQDFSEILLGANTNNNKLLITRILTAQGEIRFKMNSLTEAISLMKQSLEISGKSNDILILQKNASNLSVAYQTLGELRTSQFLMSETVLMQDLYFESRLQKLRNLWYSSTIFHDLNQSNCAVNFGEEALSLSKEKVDDVGPIFDSTLDLAIYYLPLKKYEKSASLAEQNLELAQNFEEAEARNSALANSNLQLGHTHRLTQKYEDAINYYDTAISGFEKNQEYQVDNFIAHKGRLICYEKLNRRADFEKELETVLNLFEKYRTDILEEENRNAFFDREQSVANLVVEYYLKQNNPRQALEFIESSKARSLLDLIEKKGFYDSSKREVVFTQSAKPFTVQEIQNRLQPNVQIVQYAVLENKIAVWVISNNQFKTEQISISADEIEPKIKSYLDSIKEKSPKVKEYSKELSKLLIEPILDKLDKSKLLCFIPDGILYHLPFASLPSPESRKFLIEDFALFYAPSATTSIVLAEKADHKSKPEILLAIGNPDYNRGSNSSLRPLPTAETEAKTIAGFYQTANTLVTDKAVKTEVLAELAKANIFHFAGHYVANPNSSLDSKLLLAQPPNSTNEFEGELRASEILQQRFPHLKLAILSACETGIERYYKGEGAIGMARTFLAIGTPIVVASQWKVESESTGALMIAFHRNRQEKNLPTIEALRRAQIEMLGQKKFAEPYFWSAFSAIGGNANF
jgi:CHAT domain-containing protein